MKFLRWLNILAVLTLLSACSSGAPTAASSPTDVSLPPPYVTVVSQANPSTNPESALTAYLDAFKAGDYNTMYSLLSKVSQDAHTLEDFAKRNRNALNEMSASSFDYKVLSSLTDDNAYSSQVSYSVTYHTVLVGDIQRDMVAPFTLENSAWKLKWDDGLILPELAGGNVLSMNYEIPSRGNIYDRNGDALAAQSEAYAFSILPGQVTEDSMGPLVSEASRLCGIDMETLITEINNTPAQYPIPLCTASEQESQRLRGMSPSGLQWETYTSRYYFDQGVASNVVGYTQLISAEELETYRRRGYRGDEMVGKAGIEQWAENYLAGKHGGTLYVINPATGSPVTKVGESQPQPADSIYLTLDRNLQYYTELALRPFTGAAVVIERDTGRVLAMATSPDFDSNAFQPTNPIQPGQIADIAPGAFLNRAAQGQYPLGSVFKFITMSAGMESGLYEPQTPFNCEYHWTKLPDKVRDDWTYQHCQNRLLAGKECNTSDSQPSGPLTLQEGLMRSCNPFFWDIGYTLFQNNRPNDIANMARAFGLGQPTGIQQIEEASGNIPNPATAVDVVNEAIGQGDVQVTPLQVARFIAAVGNGGTLYRPQLVEKITPVDGNPLTVFKPEAVGTLPIQPFRLQAIQEAMRWVVEDPRGTANFRLRGLRIPVAGKTGTAESGGANSHAWFAGYTMASESTNKPDIAIAVILEYQGEGSDWAAPIFQRIVETYYYDRPQAQLWFESGIFGPTLTPTPFGGVPTATPKPGKK
ncbi:MAG TPA: penicillin-binding transpeptidase domain-containing protein [Anaerolineales bacterium]|nr:penicillin-binding transpeptidase domain-containing protein [Anaerolineales bacterium]